MEGHAVVHWLNDDKPGVCVIGDVLPGDRHQGKIANVQFGSKRFPARIVLIPANEQEADKRCREMENELAAEMEKKVANSKRVHKSASSKGKASTKQVSEALKEKCPVPDGQVSKKRKIDVAKKEDKKKEKEAEVALDSQALCRSNGVKRSLFPEVGSDCEDTNFELPESSSNSKATSSSNDEERRTNYTGTASVNEACQCSLLKKHGNASIECFLTDLAKFLGIQLSERLLDDCSDVFQLQLKPLPPGVKAVDLVKHHGVLVTKAEKARILLAGKNGPRALLREALVELYGKETLKKMTGTKSLQKHVLDAFVDENTTAEARKEAKWSQSAMTRAINQKSSGLRQKSKSPSASSKKKKVKRDAESSSATDQTTTERKDSDVEELDETDKQDETEEEKQDCEVEEDNHASGLTTLIVKPSPMKTNSGSSIVWGSPLKRPSPAKKIVSPRKSPWKVVPIVNAPESTPSKSGSHDNSRQHVNSPATNVTFPHQMAPNFQNSYQYSQQHYPPYSYNYQQPPQHGYYSQGYQQGYYPSPDWTDISNSVGRN